MAGQPSPVHALLDPLLGCPASIVETHHSFGASRHVRADEAHPRDQLSPIPLRRGTGSRQLGLSAGDVLGCPSTVAGDAGVANSGVARRARPVEDIGFAGLAVAGHSDKAGFDCAVLSAGAASSLRAGVIDRRKRGVSTGLVRGRSSVGSARNCRFAVVGGGFEEVALLDASGWIVLLDAVDYGGPQRSSYGPVPRRVRRGWRSLPTTLTHIHHRSAWPRFLEVDECHAPRERCAHCASRGLMALTLMP